MQSFLVGSMGVPLPELTSLVRRMCSNLGMGVRSKQGSSVLPQHYTDSLGALLLREVVRIAGLCNAQLFEALEHDGGEGARAALPRRAQPAEQRSVALHGKPTRHSLGNLSRKPRQNCTAAACTARAALHHPGELLWRFLRPERL